MIDQQGHVMSYMKLLESFLVIAALSEGLVCTGTVLVSILHESCHIALILCVSSSTDEQAWVQQLMTAVATERVQGRARPGPAVRPHTPCS